VGNITNAYNILVRKPEVKRPLGRHVPTYKDSIKMNVKKIDCVDLIQLVQDRNK
jgi:hypothetical protein